MEQATSVIQGIPATVGEVIGYGKAEQKAYDHGRRDALTAAYEALIRAGHVWVPELDIDKVLHPSGVTDPRQLLERRVAAGLIAYLKLHGFEVVGVWDGEVYEKATDTKQAMEFIFNLDECSLRVCAAEHAGLKRKARSEHEHGILLVLGNSGWDLVSDWNFHTKDEDGFGAVMDGFDGEKFIL